MPGLKTKEQAKKIDKCVASLVKKGMKKEKAWPICEASVTGKRKNADGFADVMLGMAGEFSYIMSDSNVLEMSRNFVGKEGEVALSLLMPLDEDDTPAKLVFKPKLSEGASANINFKYDDGDVTIAVISSNEEGSLDIGTDMFESLAEFTVEFLFEEGDDSEDPPVIQPKRPFEELLFSGNSDKKSVVSFGGEIGEFADGDNVREVEMLRTGKFTHWWFGELDITRDTLKQLKENYDGGVLHRDISLDVSHMPQYGAVAWVKELSITRRKFATGMKSVLVGKCEFTDQGVNLVKSKRFKYFSIEYDFEYQDKETGEKHGSVMGGGALTNRPFIPGMRPIQFSQDAEGKPVVTLAEDPFEEANEMDFKELIVKLSERVESLEAKLSEDPAEGANADDRIALSEKLEEDKALLSSLKAQGEASEKNEKNLAKLTSQVETLAASNEAQKQINVQLAEDRRLANIAKFCAELDSKKFTPAVVAIVRKFAVADTTGTTVKLADGDKEQSYTLAEMFTELLIAMPKATVPVGDVKVLSDDGGGDDAAGTRTLTDGTVINLKEAAEKAAKKAYRKA